MTEIFELSDYEKRALQEIHDWKTPELTWFGQAMRTVDWPISKAADYAVGEVVGKAVGGVVSVCNNAAQWSVKQEAIIDEFRKAGHDVRSPSDLESLDLEDIDRVVGYLGLKYKGLASVEGATTGAMGLAGIALDVPAVVTLNLRAIGEYATYYGFDVRLQQERLFSMHVLGLASSPKDAAKVAAMAELVRIGKDAALKKTWNVLEEHAFVQLIQKIAKSVGIRLTKAKLAQVVPVLGAVVGSGFNVYYTARVCDAAYNLYRERYLANKYGADVIESTVQAAEDLADGYEDGNEVIPE